MTGTVLPNGGRAIGCSSDESRPMRAARYKPAWTVPISAGGVGAVRDWTARRSGSLRGWRFHRSRMRGPTWRAEVVPLRQTAVTPMTCTQPAISDPIGA